MEEQFSERYKKYRKLSLPKIQINQMIRTSEIPFSLKSEKDIKTKNIIYDYKNIPKLIQRNKINNNNNNDKYNLLHKLLREDNIHNLVMDNINLKNNNDLLEQMDKRKNRFNLFKNTYKNETYSQIDDAEIVLEQKNKDFNKKLISLYRMHSSKFHLKNDIYSDNINNILDKEIKLLKKEKSNNINYNEFNKKNQNNIKNLNKIRKKMAFKYRFLNNSTKNKNIKKNFELRNIKMNKILQISKSIPDILLYEIKSMQNNIKKNKSYLNDKKIEDNNFYVNYNIDKEYGLYSPFKGNRYIGNIYDYYKSNNCLSEEYLIFGKNEQDKNYIYEKVNQNNKKDIFLNNISKSNNSKINGKNDRLKVKKIDKSGLIHLSSLLI